MSAGSGEYFFGVGRGRVATELAERIDAVAKQHGAAFVTVRLPGEGWRYWFTAPSRGVPFDETTRLEVLRHLGDLGIDLEGLLP